MDPKTPGTLYAGTHMGGVFKSVNGGENWTEINIGLPTNLIVFSLAIDPETTSTLYVGTEGDGVYKSIDEGASWEPANKGLPGTPLILSLAVDRVVLNH